MSSAEAWVVRPNGDIEKYHEVENGSAGALYIWIPLSEYYSKGSYKSFAPLWQYVPLMDERDQWVIAMTSAWTLYDLQFLPTIIEHLAAFVHEYPTQTLQELLSTLRRLATEKEADAVCFNHTSVFSEMWQPLLGEDEESRPYNIYKDSKHWWMTSSPPTRRKERFPSR